MVHCAYRVLRNFYVMMVKVKKIFKISLIYVSFVWSSNFKHPFMVLCKGCYKVNDPCIRSILTFKIGLVNVPKVLIVSVVFPGCTSAPRGPVTAHLLSSSALCDSMCSAMCMKFGKSKVDWKEEGLWQGHSEVTIQRYAFGGEGKEMSGEEVKKLA